MPSDPTRTNAVPAACSADSNTPEARGTRGNVIILAVFGIALSLTVVGHFAMPHPDFFEFADAGHALLSGHLPPTMKRGPVFPLLVAAIGSILPGEAPDLTAATWLNALLLPLSGVFVFLIGFRWLGVAARWAAVAFLVMPMSLYCTAHVIVEPLLVALVLATVLFAQRGSRWAYLTASLAAMTRYDAAGLIPGLFIAEVVQRPRAGRHAALRSIPSATAGAVAAAFPLIAWLLLTAATWSTRSNDHYLSQIAQRSVGNIIAGLPRGLLDAADWAANTVFDSHIDPQHLSSPYFPQSFGDAALSAMTWTVASLAVVGLIRKTRERDGGAIAGAIALAGYLLVHAVFPFQFHRFGYPPAALLLLFACAGCVWIAGLLRGRVQSPAVRCILVSIAILLISLVLAGEAYSYAGMSGADSRPAVSRAFIAIIATAVVWAGATAASAGRAAATATFLLAALFVSIQMRTAAPLLGSGRELMNQAEAARWVREHTDGADKILSASPGLLRLYAGRSPPDRFIGFDEIRGESWADILVECRSVGVRYIIWHDQLWQEHGQYYAEKWRLGRFDILRDAENVPGVTIVRRYMKYPDLFILRVQ